MPWAFIHLALESTARLAVVPAQDLLGLGSESRMNAGTAQGNWAWQAPAGAFDENLAATVRALVAAADRLTSRCRDPQRRGRPGSPLAPRCGARARSCGLPPHCGPG